MNRNRSHTPLEDRPKAITMSLGLLLWQNTFPSFYQKKTDFYFPEGEDALPVLPKTTYWIKLLTRSQGIRHVLSSGSNQSRSSQRHISNFKHAPHQAPRLYNGALRCEYQREGWMAVSRHCWNSGSEASTNGLVILETRHHRHGQWGHKVKESWSTDMMGWSPRILSVWNVLYTPIEATSSLQHD